jgi:hypothetical protein
MLEALVYQLDGQNKFEFHREWRWKGLLTMDIVGENMAKKTFLGPHTQGVTPHFHNAKRALFFFFFSTNTQSAQNIFN